MSARPPPGRLLLVEDNPADADLVREHLLDVAEEVPAVEVAATLAEALDKLEAEDFEAVLLDLNLPDSTGPETLDRVLARGHAVPVIVLTGAGDDRFGADVVARGAADFLPKDELTGRLLLRSVRYAVERFHRQGTETRYRALVDNARELVSILDEDLSVRYVSPSIARILGHPPEEKVGADISLEVHPDDRERFRQELESLLGDPAATSHLSCRVHHRDGGWRLLDTVVHNCFGEPHIRGFVLNARDVTDLQQAQEEAARTAHRLERTLGALEDAVFTVETAGRTIIDCNAAAEAMFGHASDEMVGRTTRLLYPDRESYERFNDESIPSLRQGEAFHTEYRMRRKDGSVFPVDVTVTLLDPDEGVAGGVVSVVRDITERVEHERRVRFQSALLQQVGQPVLAVDEEGRATYWNSAAEELTGWSREELEGRETIGFLVHEEDQERALDAREIARAGGRWEGDLRFRRKDGGFVLLRITLTPAVKPDGSPGGRIVAGVDITNLRRAEEQSRRAAERLSLQADMLEAVGQAVIATDLEGRIIFWNRAAEELFGWSREEAVGRPLLEITPAAASRKNGGEMFEELRAGGTWTGEFELQRRDGSTFQALVTDAPILDDEGRLVGVIGVSSDISELKELEAQLRQAQKMEAIGRLAGGVAHDFNNLLTAVEGHATLVLEDLPDDSPFRPDLNEILQAGRRASDLTRQLLAFSRKQMLEVRRIDLGRIVLDLERMLRRLVPERIDFTVEAAAGEVVVEADPGQLQQVVMNLVVNAADAIEGSGRVSILVDGVEWSIEETEDLPWKAEPGWYARLTVEDDGVGMPPDVVDRIFEPFFTTKAEGRGTGLGLSTVYGIVKQSGGHVLIDSAPGEGTTFQVLLPRATGPAEHPSEETGETSLVDGATVLLVEDDEAVRAVSRRILTRGGYSVVEAGTGEAALRLAGTADHIDLVVSDVVMPDLGGIELYKRLRSAHPHLKVILTSGYSEAEVRGEIRELNAVFLPKPFTPEALLSCIGEVLAG